MKVLILTATYQEARRIQALLDVLFDATRRQEMKRHFAGEYCIPGSPVPRWFIEVWSMERWNDTLTCGKVFDKIVYLCKPPEFIIKELQPCDAEALGYDPIGGGGGHGRSDLPYGQGGGGD